MMMCCRTMGSFTRLITPAGNTGRTVVVNARGPVSVNVIASSVFGGDTKFLVESCRELFMVDMYLSVGPEDDLGYNENFEFYEEFDCYMSERTVKFKVFKFDKSGQKWVEVESLGDRMLFLGDNCTFSASSSDFPACRGNCIFFTDLFSYSSTDEGNRGRSMFRICDHQINHSVAGYAQDDVPKDIMLAHVVIDKEVDDG
ncbi:hypothetical protein RJ639_005330 [Escallonia herrerae]|uniref:KIB1-4 beta-propeller domain-containing protein n=1 Tax=Escallonia herrerae TaxID=1293975 RepID=A0AA88VWX8_9ASTE|nr:hypothetical protein RJ639_005330 [Escallonia herrerae]